MTRMHPLLRVALLTWPGEFRRHYADELAADLRERTAPLPLWATCANVACTGLSLHAENLWRDVSHATRVLAKAPTFVVIAIVTVSLAIAANVTAFSILKGLMLDPLPYPDANRLAFVSGTLQGVDQTSIDYPDARDFAKRSRTFSGLSVETQTQGAFTGRGQTSELRGWYVGGNFFEVLRLKPEVGRFLSSRDLGTRHVVISDALWRSRFGGDASVLGRRMTIDSRALTIVGVAPAGLYMPGPGFMTLSDYWVPINPRTANWRGFYLFYAIGRLRNDASWARAQSDLSRVAHQLAREYPSFDSHRGVRVRSLFDVLTAPTRMLVLMVYASAILIFLVAAANLANLLLSRATAREHEFAVRTSLGATRSRTGMQLGMEVVMISIAGVAVGVGLSWWCLHIIDSVLKNLTRAFGINMIIPGWNHVSVNGWVLLYGIAAALALSIGTGYAAAYSGAASLANLLNASGRSAGNLREAHVRRILTIFEITLAFAVLCNAGLLFQSFMHLEHTPVGFREANVYSVQIDLQPSSKRYGGPNAVAGFYQRAAARFANIPGVAGSAVAHVAGLGGYSSTNYSVTRPISARNGASPPKEVQYNTVSPTFFETLAIPMLRGRGFASSDTATSQPVAIVSGAFAVQNFGSIEAALNKYVSIGESTMSIGTTSGQFPMRRIVGVVGNVRHSLSDSPSPEVYVPVSQVALPNMFVVRTKMDDPELAHSLANTLTRLDPLLPPPQTVSFALLRWVDDEQTRMAADVFLGLAIIALALAFAGVYGVVAYGVQRRTQEFGVRMSLGASAVKIWVQVLRQTLLPGLIGVALGTITSAVLARGLTQFLYETSPLDISTFFATALFLMIALGIAASVPAISAVRVQPAVALRSG